MREVELLLDQPAVGENLSDHACAYGVWTANEPHEPAGGAGAGGAGGVRSLEDRALHLQLRRGRRLRPGRGRRRGARRPVPHRAAADRRRGHRATPRPTASWSSACLLTPREPRLGDGSPPTTRPRSRSIRNDVLQRRLRHGADDRRPAADPGDLRPAGPAGLLLRARSPLPDGDSDEALREHVARTTFPIYHPVGTCAIGSVVDAELRVEGLEGIRVVDCSVMPTVPRGNTNAPVIALAERAADLIKGATPLRAGAGPTVPGERGQAGLARRAPPRLRAMSRDDFYDSPLGAAYSAYMERPALQPPDRPAALGRRHPALLREHGRGRRGGGRRRRSSTAPAAPGRPCAPCDPGASVRYVAADLSPAMLRRARRRAEKRGLGAGSSSSRRRPKTCRSRTASADLFLSYWGLHCYPDPAGGDRRDRRGC